ncbi:linear amide C-N hydrolase [Bifidobacterium lemurum]|nr:linear amide C-N hydrolase [Bifidobacterium lemurum]
MASAGCSSIGVGGGNATSVEGESTTLTGGLHDETSVVVTPVDDVVANLEDGLDAASFSGNDGFSRFLARGGASSDTGVVEYLAGDMLDGEVVGSLLGSLFGCSTIAAPSTDGDRLFGRNFDWENVRAMIVESHPDDAYASISTVNMDFLDQSSDGMLSQMSDGTRIIAALYAPLDGVNEQGLAVSVNMIQDSAIIDQNTDKPDLTTTTAIRLLLNQAADVDEALALLRDHDMHSSMGMMVHFSIADADGNSVAVEYVDDEMVVVDTPVLTNFYLADGDRQGIGTEESHQRYDLLTSTLENTPRMGVADMRDALDSVSKDDFGGFSSTEWSVVYNLTERTARYYHREDYTHSFTVAL